MPGWLIVRLFCGLFFREACFFCIQFDIHIILVHDIPGSRHEINNEAVNGETIEDEPSLADAVSEMVRLRFIAVTFEFDGVRLIRRELDHERCSSGVYAIDVDLRRWFRIYVDVGVFTLEDRGASAGHEERRCNEAIE